MSHQVITIRGCDGKPVHFHLHGSQNHKRPLNTSAEDMFRRQNPGK